MELRGLGLSVFAKDVTENFGPNGSDTSGDEKRPRRAVLWREDNSAHLAEETWVMR
jgi:hypothetical protein